MEPFEIQPDAFVEKQKEVIAQLTNENILLTCRVEQLEQMLQPPPVIPDSHLHEDPRPRSEWATDSFGAPVADEVEAAERAKDDFPEMNAPESEPYHIPTLLDHMQEAANGEPSTKAWDVT